VIPPADPLVATMPSGRDIHSTKLYVPPGLDEQTLARMRAPPDTERVRSSAFDHDDSDSDDDGTPQTKQSGLPGTFPRSSLTASNNNEYY